VRQRIKNASSESPSRSLKTTPGKEEEKSFKIRGEKRRETEGRTQKKRHGRKERLGPVSYANNELSYGYHLDNALDS